MLLPSDSAPNAIFDPELRRSDLTVPQPTGADRAPDVPVKLFQTRPLRKSWNLGDVSPDGQRFLVNAPLEWAISSDIMVITNWTEKLKE